MSKKFIKKDTFSNILQLVAIENELDKVENLIFDATFRMSFPIHHVMMIIKFLPHKSQSNDSPTIKNHIISDWPH